MSSLNTLWNTLYNSVYSSVPFHWPPGQTLSTLVSNANYVVAERYFYMDGALVLMALLWGIGLAGMLVRQNAGVNNARVTFSVLVTLCIALGFAVMMAELFVLVLLKALTPTCLITAFGITSVVALLSVVHHRRDIGGVILPWEIASEIFALSVALVLCVYQIASASLWLPSDATSYHVPYAGFFLLNKGLGAIPEHLIYPYHSLNMNLLYSMGLMIDEDLSYTQTIHALFGTLTIFGMYSFSKQMGQRTFISLLLAVVFISSFSIIHHYRYSANVDNGSMYFGLCCVLALFLWVKHQSNWLLIVSAICFGIAIGTKYLMCAFAFPIVICIVITQGRNWKALTTYATWAAAWGLWWYLRNFIATGNPFHPFATGIFGLYLWDQSDVIQQMAGLHDERVPRSIAGFLLMPYYAYKNDILASQGAAIQLAILYASTVLFWKMSKPVNCVLIFCWAYLVIWFFGAQDPRYLMPITPLILVYAGAVTSTIWSGIRPVMLNNLLAYIATPVALVTFGYFSQQDLVKIYYSDVGSSFEVRDAVMRQNPTYDVMSHANEIFDEHSTVYEFYMRDGRWFFKGNLVGNQFGPHGYYHVMTKAMDESGLMSPEKLENILKASYNADGFIIPTSTNGVYDREEFDNYFNLRYRNILATVYEFKKH